MCSQRPSKKLAAGLARARAPRGQPFPPLAFAIWSSRCAPPSPADSTGPSSCTLPAPWLGAEQEPAGAASQPRAFGSVFLSNSLFPAATWERVLLDWGGGVGEGSQRDCPLLLVVTLGRARGQRLFPEVSDLAYCLFLSFCCCCLQGCDVLGESELSQPYLARQTSDPPCPGWEVA